MKSVSLEAVSVPAAAVSGTAKHQFPHFLNADPGVSGLSHLHPLPPLGKAPRHPGPCCHWPHCPHSSTQPPFHPWSLADAYFTVISFLVT